MAQRVAEPRVEQTPAGGRDALYRERLAGAADDLDQQHLRSRAMDVARGTSAAEVLAAPVATMICLSFSRAVSLETLRTWGT